MKEATGDIWKWIEDTSVDAICITTNGTIKKCGDGVMGAGIAKQAAERFPELPKILGDHIKTLGNHVNVLQYIANKTDNECRCPGYTYLVAFPVKHNWYENADLTLIATSCKELSDMATRAGWDNVVLPRPGCGNGNLSWDAVKLILQNHLDDRFTIVDMQG